MRPNIYFSQSINERSWHVWRPIVKIGEHNGKFFYYVDSDDCDKRELIAPPRGLYGKEFLELDYHNIFQLTEFQRKWGPITGLRARPNTTFERGSYPIVAKNDSFYKTGEHPVFHPDGIQKTEYLYEGMGEIDIIARERFGAEDQSLHRIVTENWRKRSRPGNDERGVVPCHVASVEEVAEAVCDAQVAIRAIANTLRSDYTDSEWKQDKGLVHECVRYANAMLTGSVNTIDIIEDESREGVCTLMQHLFICLAKGVMLNNAYRFCQNPECGRLFTPKEYDRRVDSKYCCEECQIKAKYLRTFRKGAKKRESPQSCDSPNEASHIEIEWSTSNIPVRVLRRDQVRLPGDKPSASSVGTENQPLLTFSFLGLTTGNPDTENILEELKARNRLTRNR